MNLDPRWITTRYRGSCSRCGAGIPAGTQAFYYPNGKQLYGKTCCDAAQEAAADFNAAVFDEAQYHGHW